MNTMMTTRNFDIAEIKETVETMGIPAEIVTTIKNGINMSGLKIIDGGSINPVIFYTGESTKDYIAKILDVLSSDHPDIDINLFRDRDFVLSHVRICVQKLSEEDIPKKQILNLEAYLRLDMPSKRTDNTIGTVKVTKDFITLCGIDFERLWSAAEKNTLKGLRFSSLEEEMGLPSDMPHLFDIVLYKDRDNGTSTFGASALLFDEIFDAYCEAHDIDACVILPSSIHEVLVLDPASIPGSYADMCDLVRSVNDAEVSPWESLTPTVFLFERSKGIRIVAEEQEA